uniref:Uncharacterized protein n=1 Tax=Oryza sativa subsp. japonica TaxID=39947 RepID=Q8L4B8_ORYSJ|nr:hypothetical protein [Oryza sativa Japonica Group]BAC10172.1 hypothetical protein [Oryza sativa Japonica Group]
MDGRGTRICCSDLQRGQGGWMDGPRSRSGSTWRFAIKVDVIDGWVDGWMDHPMHTAAMKADALQRAASVVLNVQN